MRKIIGFVSFIVAAGVLLAGCFSVPSILKPKEQTADPALLVTMYVQGTLLAQEAEQIRAVQETIQVAAAETIDAGLVVVDQNAVESQPTAESLETLALSEVESPLPTKTFTLEPTLTHTVAAMVEATATPSPSSAPTSTPTAAKAASPTPSLTSRPSATQTSEATLIPTATPTSTPSPTETPAITETASLTVGSAQTTPTGIPEASIVATASAAAALGEQTPTALASVETLASPTPGSMPILPQPPSEQTPFAPAQPPIYPPPPPTFGTPPPMQSPYWHWPPHQHPGHALPNIPSHAQGSLWGSCLRAEIVWEETRPAAEELLPGQSFTHTWLIKNSGDCTWEVGTVLMFDGGEPMGNLRMTYLVNPVAPGENVEISLDLIAPTIRGDYTSFWIFSSPEGLLFGAGPNGIDSLDVNISVTAGHPIILFDGIAQACQAKWSTGQGLTNCGWSMDQASGVWVFSNAILEGGIVADQPVLAVAPNPGQGGRLVGRYPPVYILAGDLFDAWVGCLEGFPACDLTFSLQAVVDGRSPKTLATWRQVADGVFKHVQVDLSSFTSRYVTLILSVKSNAPEGGPVVGFWMKPVVIR